MTQSASLCAADRPPAMYRSATLATVVSRISMNVGTTTTRATIQWLTAGRLAAPGLSVTVLMRRPPGPLTFRARGASFGSRLGVGGSGRQGGMRLQVLPGVRPRGRLLVVDAGLDRQADEQGGLVRVVVGQLDADRQPLHDLDEVAGG